MDVKYGRDEGLEALADNLLNASVRDNARGIQRDIEKMSYEHGFITEDHLKHYDPANDWETLDSAFAIVIAPSDIEFIEPGYSERRALVRHVGDGDDWGSSQEDIPLLGINDGPRKVCIRCKKPKGFMCFSPKDDAKDGLHPWCKECRKEFVSQQRNNSRSGNWAPTTIVKEL